MSNDRETMHIGELAERTGLSLRTLRHYDEIGLVAASGRTEGGFRLYTHDDYERLMLIRRMKPLGYSLEEMIELLDVIAGVTAAESDADARLDGFVQSATERREKLRSQLEMADEFIALLNARR
ncbi:MerR family transcriptional regulator [Labedella endophytica]|uniref:MerR family transcriptional regulator n=1 Tax=Labedella endophytica TaxID=1523160 RepID=A0A433JVJ6_9MICO|nr:MerR family transcriptional regulator [Labedella endophytica]RUR03181.1 MerR family transcriptional regulator [Labedella endophytica]